LSLRTNDLELGLWIFKTAGSADAVLAMDRFLVEYADHWFVRETIGKLRRTLARLDVTSRSIFAVIEPGSCFAGTLFELALAADRSYILDASEGETASVALSEMNFGPLPMANHLPRIAARFYGDRAAIEALRRRVGEKSRRAMPPKPASSQRLPMNSTGKTNCAWRSNRAPRFRPTRSPGLKRICGSACRKRWKRGFLAAFPPGKTGFQPAERDWRARRAENLWHGRAGEIRLGARLTRAESGIRRRRR